MLVYAEKAVHTHEVTDLVCYGITHTNVSANCNICDFQLARDMELPVQPGLHAAPIFYQEPYPVLFISLHPSSCITPAERGPPAI